MKKLIILTSLILIILIAGCIQQPTGQAIQQTKYVCPDGSTVSDASLCQKQTNQQSSQVASSIQQTESKQEEIASKTLNYVNENLVETGKTASLTSIEKFYDLYNATFSYQGRVVSIFVTTDGNYVFLSAPIIINGTASSTKPEDISSKTLKYINENLVQAGSTASYVSVVDFEELYNITVAYQGKDVSVFSTKDGNYVFLSAPLNMNEKPPVQVTQQSPETKFINKTITRGDFEVTLVDVGYFTHLKYDTWGDEVTEFKADIKVKNRGSISKSFNSYDAALVSGTNQYSYSFNSKFDGYNIYPGVIKEGYIIYQDVPHGLIGKVKVIVGSAYWIAQDYLSSLNILYEFDISL